jgi:hypothetical protein
VESFAFGHSNPLSQTQASIQEARTILSQNPASYLQSRLAKEGNGQVVLLMSLNDQAVESLPSTKSEIYAWRRGRLAQLAVVAWLVFGGVLFGVGYATGSYLAGFVVAIILVAAFITASVYYHVKSRTSAVVRISGKKVRRTKLNHVSRLEAPTAVSTILLSSSVPNYSVCKSCGGKRIDTKTMVCGTCGGRGQVPVRPNARPDDDDYGRYRTCWRCNGRGKVDVRLTCQVCLGKGGFDPRQAAAAYNAGAQTINDELMQMKSKGLDDRVAELNRSIDGLNHRIDVWNSKFE